MFQPSIPVFALLIIWIDQTLHQNSVWWVQSQSNVSTTCFTVSALRRNMSTFSKHSPETLLKQYFRPLYRKYDLGTTVFCGLAQGFLTGKVGVLGDSTARRNTYGGFSAFSTMTASLTIRAMRQSKTKTTKH